MRYLNKAGQQHINFEKKIMLQRDEQPIARAMYILGQIGAMVCHEQGPKPDISILTHMAAHPAEGFWLAVSSIDGARAPGRGRGRTLTRWKRKEIARLGRLLPHPLPASASAQAQMPFWAGYCQYWDDVLKSHVPQAASDSSRKPDGRQPRHVNA
jgi:hypothetical protein